MKPPQCSAGVDEDGNNESVKTNSLGENEDKDHSDEDTITLSEGSDTSVTSNTNSKSGGKGGESATETSSEDLVTSSSGFHVSLITGLGVQEYGNDKTINTQDTRHNNWDKGLEDLG